MPRRHHDLDALLEAKILKTDGGCWLWTGSLQDSGYGIVATRPGGQGRQRVHRLMYERHVGPIPDGMTVEHRCHTDDTTCAGGRTCQHRRCCNPEHLELLTPAANTARARNPKAAWTHCPRGHEFTAANTRIRSGRRACRACDNARKRAYYAQAGRAA